MPPTKNKKRAKTPSAMDRRGKKKVSILTLEKIEYVDWKDVNLLRRFVSDRAKIRARRVTGNSAQQQRDVAMAIKNAREMALLPYTSKVTTQRGGRGGDRRQRDDDRRPREPREPRAPEAQKKPSPPKPETEQQEQVIDIPEVAAEVTQETTTEETTE